MTQSSRIASVCSHCGEKHNVEVYNSINVSLDASLKEKVLDGSLFMWECPHCGTTNLIQGRPLYHDPAERLMIWVTGEDETLEEQTRGLFSKLEEMKSYTLRFVRDTGTLIEKLKIFDAGLDDVTVEMCKYITRMEICEHMTDQEKAAAVMDAPMKFLRMEGADNEITLAYPMDGQMQMVAIGFNVYEDCRGIIKRNPAITQKATGFCRVDRGWLEAFFG